MKKQDKVTSTERLLEIIRDTDSSTTPGLSDYNPLGAPAKARFAKMFGSSHLSFGYWRSHHTVGVDIEEKEIRLVKISPGSKDKRRLVDYRMVPLPAGTKIDSPEMSELLAASLNAFCGKGARVEIWTSLPAVNVEVRTFLIPRVAARQIPNIIYWHAKKEGIPLDEKQYILDYEVYEEVYEQGKPKLSVMVYSAPAREVTQIKKLFLQSGWPLTGLTIVPFAIQNLWRTQWLKTEGETIAHLFIGHESSRINIYLRGNLLMTRSIKAGLSSLAESLVDEYNLRLSRQADYSPVSLDLEAAQQILINLCSGNDQSSGTSAGYDLAEADVLPMMAPALDRLIRQVERTFEHYAFSTGRNMVQTLYCSSVIGAYRPIMDYLKSHMSLKVEILDPVMTMGNKTEREEENLCERICYAAAIGLALAANNHTPNLLFTYREKLEQESTALVNKTIFLSFITMVVVCSALYLYLVKTAAESEASLAAIKNEFQQLGQPLDEKSIAKELARLQQKNIQNKAYGERSLSLATVAELAALTPPEIRLTSMESTFPAPPAAQGQTGASPPAVPEKKEEASIAEKGRIVIEGIVTSPSTAPDMILAEYAMKLDKSPLFRGVTIQKSSPPPAGNKNTLLFSMEMKFE